MSLSFKHIFRCFVKQCASVLIKPKSPALLRSDDANYRTMQCKRENLSLVSETNAIFHVVTESSNGYFCPCRKHLPIQEYVSQVIDDYYSFITEESEHAETDKAIVIESLKNDVNFKEFVRMGSPLQPHSGCSVFLRSGDSKAVGLQFDSTDTRLLQRMKHFVGKYAWCQMNAYQTNHAVGLRRYQTLSSNKSLASEALAQLLGLGELFPHAEYMYLDIQNHRKIFGIYTVCADGNGIIGITHKARYAMLTPEFQRCMSNLNVMDVITHEMDHSPNNYYVVTDDYGMAVRPSVFDNNGVGTFALNNNISFHTNKNCSPFLLPDGRINRPHLDRQLVMRIRNITILQLYQALRSYLPFIQIHLTWMRLQKLKQAIAVTAASNHCFLLDNNQWSADTIQAELSGKYGKTYLQSFIQDCCVIS